MRYAGGASIHNLPRSRAEAVYVCGIQWGKCGKPGLLFISGSATPAGVLCNGPKFILRMYSAGSPPVNGGKFAERTLYPGFSCRYHAGVLYTEIEKFWGRRAVPVPCHGYPIVYVTDASTRYPKGD